MKKDIIERFKNGEVVVFENKMYGICSECGHLDCLNKPFFCDIYLYIFAFDDYKLLPLIEKKLKLLEWVSKWRLTFYIYIHPKMPLSDTVNRINYLRERKILPYLMRDFECYKTEYTELHSDLAEWCNKPEYFLRSGFEKTMKILGRKPWRIKRSVEMFNEKRYIPLKNKVEQQNLF